jgi:hypothetical protein
MHGMAEVRRNALLLLQATVDSLRFLVGLNKAAAESSAPWEALLDGSTMQQMHGLAQMRSTAWLPLPAAVGGLFVGVGSGADSSSCEFSACIGQPCF